MASLPLLKGSCSSGVGSLENEREGFREEFPALISHGSKEVFLNSNDVPKHKEDDTKAGFFVSNGENLKSGGGPKRRAWNNLFNPKKGVAPLEFVAPKTIENDLVIASIPMEIVELGKDNWSKSLVGYGVGKKLPFMLVKKFVEKIWKSFGKIEVLSNGQGCFIFNFDDESKLVEALEGGPWHIGGQPLVLKKWTTNLNLAKEGLKKISIWVKIFGVPLELWTALGLSHVASTLGTPLCMDSFTEERKRIEFARICVEFESNSSFPEVIGIRMPNGEIMKLRVEYSWKPTCCSWCKTFGHVRKDCIQAPKEVSMKTPKKPIGEWRVASKSKVLSKCDEVEPKNPSENHLVATQTLKNPSRENVSNPKTNAFSLLEDLLDFEVNGDVRSLDHDVRAKIGGITKNCVNCVEEKIGGCGDGGKMLANCQDVVGDDRVSLGDLGDGNFRVNMEKDSRVGSPRGESGDGLVGMGNMESDVESPIIDHFGGLKKVDELESKVMGKGSLSKKKNKVASKGGKNSSPSLFHG